MGGGALKCAVTTVMVSSINKFPEKLPLTGFFQDHTVFMARRAKALGAARLGK